MTARARIQRRAESLAEMCGIAGIIAPGPQKPLVMQRMLDALAHRGPDDEATEQNSHAILGHRRLSIIDLEGGRQPLTNADRSVWLVCNGEIYNNGKRSEAHASVAEPSGERGWRVSLSYTALGAEDH